MVTQHMFCAMMTMKLLKEEIDVQQYKFVLGALDPMKMFGIPLAENSKPWNCNGGESI